MLRPIAKRPAIGLLADERDHAGPERAGERLEPFGTPLEVACPEVSGAGRRAVGGIRDADSESQQLELLGRLEEARREAGLMQQAPEVVPGIGEVRVRAVGEATGVDPAEDDQQPRRENVGDG